MGIEKLANEYQLSATIIKERIELLKATQKTKKFDEQKTIEDRIIVLNAEYHHLLRTASYLDHYYDESKDYEGEEINTIKTTSNVINCAFLDMMKPV